jgi:hypothetical protein
MLYLFDVAENEGFDKKKQAREGIDPWNKSFEEQLLELLDYVSGDFGKIEEEIEEVEEETEEEKAHRWNILDLKDD